MVQLGKPPSHIDSGTNLELFSSQKMRTRLIFEKNTWTQIIFRSKHVDLIKFSVFYPHKATSLFLPSLLVFYPKF